MSGAGPGPDVGELEFRMRPAAGPPAGALILNHGRGADEHDLYPLLDQLDPERRLLGVSSGAPIRGLPPGGRHWYIVERVGFPHHETFHSSYSDLADGIDAILAGHGLDYSQAVIGGFSQGAVMSYAVALGADRPTPAGIIALSGFLPVVEGWEPVLEGREGLRAFIHHGARDPVIASELGARAAETLRAGGIDVEFLETPVGHALPPQAVVRARALVAAVTGAASGSPA